MAGFTGAGNCDEGLDGGEAVIGGGAMLGGMIENGAGESLDLTFVGVGIFAEWPMELAVFGGETFNIAGFVEPREVDACVDAAVFAIDLEAFAEIAPNGNGQIEVTQGAAGEFAFNEPAITIVQLGEARADGLDIAGQESRGINEVTAMGEDEVAAFIGFWVSFGSPGLGALNGDRLKIIGHGVAIGGIAIPGFEGDEPADFALDEIAGKGDAGIEAPVVADLEDPVGGGDGVAQVAAFLDGDPEGFFDQDMFSGLKGFECERDMELIGDPDDDGVDVRIGEHCIQVVIDFLRRVDGGHAVGQVAGQIADGIELGVFCFATGVEMSDLGDGSASEDGDVEVGGGFGHGKRKMR